MDRELDASYRYRRLGRKAVWGVGGIALCAAILVLLPGWLRPSVARAEVRTGKVDRGPVEGIVEASGVVIPAFEGALSSPIDARVEKVLKRPGEMVKAGEAILKLDTSTARLELEKIEDQLAKKSNEQRQVRITLEKSLSDLRGQIERQKLDAEASAYRAEQNRKLRADGLVSEQTLKAAEVEAKKAEIELAQLQESVGSARRSTDAQLEGLELDLATLRREREDARRLLELATTRSDRSGVLTWVVPQEGVTVPRGQVIARIADLDSFRVEATVSDVHSSSLHAGQLVRVMLDGQPLTGKLAAIDPTIENGVIKFKVDLDDGRHSKLRNNLRVDVLAVTDTRSNTLRVPKGPFARAGATEKVFVVQGDQAVRRTVRLGLSGYEFYEVLEGLDAGEEVILSDMRDFEDLERVTLK
ncbi:MAG TPA: HlyD family efflux transporter periplasmic adaptor subunit [Thermoanaerobaculia bacterium]|jgi:HlyD family secretion protein|nr:HlyD family efflux transporter periplasmic adaptor subunit [Thermoanaerobaculia bacterium]